MTRRSWAAIILATWAVLLGWLVKREVFQSPGDRLAAAALSVPPGTNYCQIQLGERQVGVAAITWDTLGPRLRVTDVLVLDAPSSGGVTATRASASAVVTRALRLRTLDVTWDANDRHVSAHGAVTGDSVLEMTVDGGAVHQSTRIRLKHPVVLPSLVPLWLALGGALKPGRTVSVPVFDPFSLAARDLHATIAAETTLVVTDSAGFDSTTQAWVPAHRDSVRAFEIDEGDSAQTIRTWVDAEGHLVGSLSPGGLGWMRSAYEIAFENFRAHRPQNALGPGDTVGVAAGLCVPPIPTGSGYATLRVRVERLDLTRLRLGSSRQEVRGDTVSVRREGPEALAAAYRLQTPPPGLAHFLVPEPLIPSTSPSIVAQARQVLDHETDPGRAARRLVDWVATHVHRGPGAPSPLPRAIAALTGAGVDCNDATALYVALARAVGLPARPVAGLLVLRGRIYYHAWAEVYLGGWVAVDPLLDQMPADAGHVRFTIGAFAQPLELVAMIGHARLDIL